MKRTLSHIVNFAGRFYALLLYARFFIFMHVPYLGGGRELRPSLHSLGGGVKYKYNHYCLTHHTRQLNNTRAWEFFFFLSSSLVGVVSVSLIHASSGNDAAELFILYGLNTKAIYAYILLSSYVLFTGLSKKHA